MSRKKLNPSESDLRKSVNDWAGIIADAVQSQIESVPQGWQTMSEISAELGLSEAQTRQRLKPLKESGAVISKKFTIQAGERIYPVLHYRIK